MSRYGIAFVGYGDYIRVMEDHKNARFVEADFSGARFHGVNFSNVKISDAWLFNVDISGLVGNLSVNGIDVSAYVEAELNKRHPERLLLVPFDPDGMRTAWEAVERFAAATLDRARACLPTTSTSRSTTSGRTSRRSDISCSQPTAGSPAPCSPRPNPFHPLGLPNPPIDEVPPPCSISTPSRPSTRCWPSAAGGWTASPNTSSASTPTSSPGRCRHRTAASTSVMSCLHIVFREEWWHDQYANRDLAILERGPSRNR